MNILIITDLEGISGVDDIAQMNGDGYAYACTRLMADVNAAIRGAFDSGAKNVYVVDGHGGGKNFIEGLLDKRAQVITVHDRLELLRSGDINAGMLVGYHAMAGTINGFLDHTQSSASWFDYQINGRKCGEIAQCALYYGHFGVPIVTVTGDEAACVEARAFLGDIAIAPVKQGLCRNKARLYDLKESEQKIYLAAIEGINKRQDIRPFKMQFPLNIQLTFTRTDYCENAYSNMRDRVDRIDARTLCRTVDKIEKFTDILF